MVEVTVEEMWRMALPAGTTLVGGATGLSRAVTWPVTLRTRPPAFESVKGGEVALVSTATIKMLDERLTLARIIRSLGDMGASAVVVLGEVGEDAREASDSLGMPIFALPRDVRMQEVEQSVTRAIADRRMTLHQRGQDIQRQLTDLIIEGRGLAAIVERVAHIAGKPAAMGDHRGRVRFYSVPPGAPLALERDQVVAALETGVANLPELFPAVSLSASDPPRAKVSLDLEGLAGVVAPITVKGSIRGYCWMLAPELELGELEGLAVRRAAAACALELSKEIAVLEAEDRLHGDLLEDILLGDLTSVESLRKRAERLGWSIDQPSVALVFEVGEEGGRPSNGRTPAGFGRPQNPRLAEAVERRLSRRGIPALVGIRSGRVVALCAHRDPDDTAVKRDVEEIRRDISSQLGETALSVGLGRYHPGVSGQRESYQEAEQSLAMGIRLFGPGRVTFFGDLGIYRLLFRMHGAQELEAFYESALGKILEYERKNGAEFVKTLNAYFACRNSPTEAADILHLHRNTLLYRLRRIEEIAGISLDDPETRLALHLALRIRETLQAVEN